MNIFKPIIKFLSSKKLAFLCMIIISLAIVAEMIALLLNWDSSKTIAEQSGFIYKSLPFQGVCLFFLLNLTTCTIKGAVARIQKRQGFRLWASTLFHVGLILMLAGCLLTANYQMKGSMALIQGETKFDKFSEYTNLIKQRFFRDKDFRGFGLTLVNQDITLNDKGKIKKTESVIEIKKGDKTSVLNIQSDRQTSYGYTYLIGADQSYAVSLRQTLKSGKAREITIPLESKNIVRGYNFYTLDSFQIRNFPQYFSLQLYPDLARQGEKSVVNKSFSLTNPAIRLQVRTEDDISQKILRPGETFKLKEGDITFLAVKPTATVIINHDPGAKLLFTGMLFSAAGLGGYYLVFGPRIGKVIAEART